MNRHSRELRLDREVASFSLAQKEAGRSGDGSKQLLHIGRPSQPASSPRKRDPAAGTRKPPRRPGTRRPADCPEARLPPTPTLPATPRPAASPSSPARRTATSCRVGATRSGSRWRANSSDTEEMNRLTDMPRPPKIPRRRIVARRTARGEGAPSLRRRGFPLRSYGEGGGEKRLRQAMAPPLPAPVA